MNFSAYLDNLSNEGNLRQLPRMSTQQFIDFSTNDYLGLGSDTELQARFFADPASLKVPMTSSASRLLASRQIEYENLEVALKLLYSKRRGDDTGALLFNSGYHANTGLIPAIASKDTYIIADRLVHASIIDGMILAKAPFTRFRHNDYGHLRELLIKNAPQHKNILVIVESVYSMDGDRADIEALLGLRREFPSVSLYVDEAHAFGVLGPHGLGLVAESSAPWEVDFVIGTFGKAAASIGAFAITSNITRDYLINTARSFIFSTALPPMQIAWSRFTLGQLLHSDAKRTHLNALAIELQRVLSQFSVIPIEVSHIQPLIIGDPKEAVDLSNRLMFYGIKALPIRKPTVPAGTDRLRFSLSAAMSTDDINILNRALRDLLPVLNPLK
ncbi:MAG: 8-amino-7-oxononanoate synthase [Muribaculaceae bacterium]|nr:8-amino-7-oxononanoate synthase [Muribaculaceae bacterium]